VLLVAEDFSEGDVGFNVSELHGEIPCWTGGTRIYGSAYNGRLTLRKGNGGVNGFYCIPSVPLQAALVLDLQVGYLEKPY
jgi:hypothetical protein